VEKSAIPKERKAVSFHSFPPEFRVLKLLSLNLEGVGGRTDTAKLDRLCKACQGRETDALSQGDNMELLAPTP